MNMLKTGADGTKKSKLKTSRDVIPDHDAPSPSLPRPSPLLPDPPPPTSSAVGGGFEGAGASIVVLAQDVDPSTAVGAVVAKGGSTKRTTSSSSSSVPDGGGRQQRSSSAPEGGRQQRPSISTLVTGCLTLSDIPLLLNLLSGDGLKSRKEAAKALYELGDVGHKSNRLPMVNSDASTYGDVTTAIAKATLASHGDTRHLCLLALNNLTIPSEAKRILAPVTHCEKSFTLINTLVEVVVSDPSEGYLALICLMNLSFFERGCKTLANTPNLLPSLTAILVSAAAATAATSSAATTSPSSLKPTVFSPASSLPLLSPNRGGDEGARWSCGLLKNLSRSRVVAAKLLRESPGLFAALAATIDKDSLCEVNSTQDFAIFAMLNLAFVAVAGVDEDCKSSDSTISISPFDKPPPPSKTAFPALPLLDAGSQSLAIHALRLVVSKGGRQSPLAVLKATMTLALLPAAKADDLQPNTIRLLADAFRNALNSGIRNETGGGGGGSHAEYPQNMFKLRLASLALKSAALKTAGRQESLEELSCAATVAAMLQCITAFVVTSSNENNEEHSQRAYGTGESGSCISSGSVVGAPSDKSSLHNYVAASRLQSLGGIFPALDSLIALSVALDLLLRPPAIDGGNGATGGRGSGGVEANEDWQSLRAKSEVAALFSTLAGAGDTIPVRGADTKSKIRKGETHLPEGEDSGGTAAAAQSELRQKAGEMNLAMRSSGARLPRLAAAHLLWLQQRERDGVMASFFAAGGEGIEVGEEDFEGPASFIICGAKVNECTSASERSCTVS